MQYWKPRSEDEFAGDMMPYWDGEQFHLFYLLDRNHHAEQGGLGGHQWAHASTTNMVDWEHHPLALPIGAPGTADENGICTGSIFAHEGVYHAFYAARLKRPDGSVYEAVCRAAGQDLIHFEKSPGNPMFSAPPGLDPRNHRDPFVFQHPATGVFHMLVTASRLPGAPSDPGPERGVLAHYSSEDLVSWRYQGPFLPLDKDPSPECPEHFFWNGWWYLVYSQHAQLQYWVSRDPLGPWERTHGGTLEGRTLTVPRTAQWKDGRRLEVGFLPWRRDGRDDEDYVYAGNVVFRELLQNADGAWSTRFVPEMMPRTGPPVAWQLHAPAPNAVLESDGAISLNAGEGVATAHIPDVSADVVLTLRIVPSAGATEYGLLLRADANLETGYRLRFLPGENQVQLQCWPARDNGPSVTLSGVGNLNKATDVTVCLVDSVIDVCINERQTLTERCFDYRGTHLGLYATTGQICIENLRIATMLQLPGTLRS